MGKTTTFFRYAPVPLALLSSVLFAWSLPSHNQEWLGWFALAPLLFAASQIPRTLWAFGLGVLTGIVTGMIQVGFRGAPGSLNYAYVPYIWIAFVFGVVAAFAQWSRRQRGGSGVRWILSVAGVGVAAEWLTHLSPLPVNIALCQHRTLPIIQIASVTGIWGVSFLLYLVNAAFAEAGLTNIRKAALPLTVAATLLLLNAGFGFLAVEARAVREKSESVERNPFFKQIIVAAIQDYNGMEAQGKDPYAPTPPDNLPDSVELIRQAAKKGALLIVGTENAFGYSFTPDEPRCEMNRVARETGRYLVVGHEMNAKPTPFNCASLVSPEGKTLGTHHKIALFLGERQTMQAGVHASAFDSPLGKIGMLICFDNCYTLPAREAALAGAVLIAQPNYDPPTPNAALHHLHAAVTPFRAVENRLPIIRADPNGQSQIVDSTGRITATAPMYRSQALTGKVFLSPTPGGTFFTHWGDWFVYLCLAGLSAATFAPLILLRRQERK